MTNRAETGIGAKLLLAVGSVVVTFLALEFLAPPLLLPHTPLKLHIYLDEGIRALAQSSKKGTVPEDYVLIVGDSYAQGRGDWLLSVNANRNPPFNSAHVIQARTGRDVINFARGGSGAVRGLIADPIAKYHYLRASSRFDLAPPKDVLVYFYEGNDLEDTLVELADYFGEGRSLGLDPEGTTERNAVLPEGEEEDLDYFRSALDHPELRNPDYFRKAVEEQILPGYRLERRARQLAIWQELYFVRFVVATLTGGLGRKGKDAPIPHDQDFWPETFQKPTMVVKANQLVSMGQQVKVNVELQGPAPELDAEETDLALYAFEQSLLYLRDFFSSAHLCLVYLPSPATSYASAGETVIVQPLGARPSEWPSQQVQERSVALRGRLGQIAARSGVDFVDASGPIRRHGRRQLLHGMVDWRHFNQAGYTVLGNAASACLKP